MTASQWLDGEAEGAPGAGSGTSADGVPEAGLRAALGDERERLIACRDEMVTAFEQIQADFEARMAGIESRLVHVDALLEPDGADAGEITPTSLLARRLRSA